MMNIENIKVGEMYKYRELCKLLGVKCQESQNKRIELYTLAEKNPNYLSNCALTFPSQMVHFLLFSPIL